MTGGPDNPVDRLWVVSEARDGGHVLHEIGREVYRSPRPAVMAVTMTLQELEWATPPSQFEGDTPLSLKEQRLLCHLCAGRTLFMVGSGAECCEELGELGGRGVRLVEFMRVNLGGGMIVHRVGLHPDLLDQLDA